MAPPGRAPSWERATPETLGEKWLDAAEKKLAGYVKTHGWTSGPLVLISSRRKQYTMYIRDAIGAACIVAIEMDADVAYFVDDYGHISADPISAVLFDEVIEPHGLSVKCPVCKRQLPLALPEPAIEW